MSTVRVAVSLAVAAMCAVLPASSSAAGPQRCGGSYVKDPAGPGWFVEGNSYVSMSHQTGLRLKREEGPGVEGFVPTVADVECNVAVSVVPKAARAWGGNRRRVFSISVRSVGAGRNPQLGRFRCTVVPSREGKSATCRHAADPHEGQIVVRFTIVRG